MKLKTINHKTFNYTDYLSNIKTLQVYIQKIWKCFWSKLTLVSKSDSWIFLIEKKYCSQNGNSEINL